MDVIEEASQLLNQIRTCELLQSAILNYVHCEGHELHKLTLEDILLAVHNKEIELRTELFHATLEQAIQANNKQHYS